MRVAVLGLGRMGHPIARHVLEGGHELIVWNRTPGRADDLVAAGAAQAPTPAAAVSDAQVVVLVLFGPDTVRQVLAGDSGVLGSAPRGCAVVDATTIGPADARAFAGLAQPYGVTYLDAPLFGSVEPAQAGTLGSYLGGSAADVERVRPVVETWCDPTKVVHAGSVGAAAAIKLVRNMGHGIATEAIGECLRVAADFGVPRDVAVQAVAEGPFGWTLGWRRDGIARRDHREVVFSLDLLAKDLALAVDQAGSQLPVAEAALEQARRAQAAGRGAEDFAALADWVEGG